MLAGVETWLRSRRPAVVLAIVVVSVALRITYFVEIDRGPLVWQHRWDQSDMNEFDAWGKGIASGDWLSVHAFMPMHLWHREMAEIHFRQHPDEAARLEKEAEAAGAGFDRDRLLWTRWTGGGKAFYQEPLYPYLVASTYALMGPDPRWVFAWQLAVGVMSNLLVYLLARRSFGDLVGTLAAGIATLYSPLLTFEMILLRETLIAFTGLALVWLAGIAFERRSRAAWILTGAAFGLALLLKTTFALIALLLLGGLVYSWRAERRALLAAVAGCLVGFALVLAPCVVRNAIVGAPLTRLPGSGTATFIHGNLGDYTVAQGTFSLNLESAARIMGKTDGRLLPTVIETLRTHSSPWSYLGQLLTKLSASWFWYEVPSNENFYYYRLQAPVLRYMPFTFWIVSPLALVGLAIARPARGGWLVYSLVVSCLAPLVLFMSVSRYRLPLAAAVIPFAAVTLAEILRRLARREYRRLAAVTFAVVAVALWTGRPLPADTPLVRGADFVVPHKIFYEPEVDRALRSGDRARAIRLLEDSLRLESSAIPEDPSAASGAGPDRGLLRFYSSIHRRLASLLAEAGDRAGASEHEARSRQLDARAGADLPSGPAGR